jgi:replicative DNA helicase
MLTGFGFIDKYLGGIAENEFMIIGFETGGGKTALANILAYTLFEKGIKPGLFSIENTKGDTELLLAYKFWRRDTRMYDTFYRTWRDMPFDSEAVINATIEAKNRLKNVFLIENTGVYTTDTLVRDLTQAKEQGCQVIILDHLDFIHSDDRDLVGSQNKIVSICKNFIDTNRIPIIAFSQITRKLANGVKIPEQGDFFGSSNKAKLATTIIMAARAYENGKPQPHLFPTWFFIRKDRYGKATNLGEVINYDARSENYEKEGIPLRVNPSGTKITSRDAIND